MKQTKKPKKEKQPKSTNSFWCDTCKTKEMTHQEMMDHLKSAHGIDPKTTKCRRTMTLHLDGREFFQSQYLITFDDPHVELTNEVCCGRAKDDMMRFA